VYLHANNSYARGGIGDRPPSSFLGWLILKFSVVKEEQFERPTEEEGGVQVATGEEDKLYTLIPCCQ